MNATTGAPAAPGLSSLTKRERLNIAVARTQGWEAWHYPADPHAYLFPAGWFDKVDRSVRVFLEGDGGKPVEMLGLGPVPPDYAGDPSAWGALMETEGLLRWERGDDGRHHAMYMGEDARGRFSRFGPWCSSIGESVCAAVLAKYGVDPSPYIGD